MLPFYAIVPGRYEHIARLTDIELSAARLLEGYAPESVLSEATTVVDFRAAVDAGLLWVAVSDAQPVGFAQVKLLEAGRAHLDELDVYPDHGRRGVGRRLVRAVCDWAAASQLDSVTLSTFRGPPWNAPFYASMGFRALADDELTPALRCVVAKETRRGLDPTQRVVMSRATRLPILPGQTVMTAVDIHIGDAPDLETFLAERIYEFNAAATGYRDAESFAASRRGDSGEIEAGITGFTWGGSCFVSYLWVSEVLRGKGIGGGLLSAAEVHARGKGCRVVVLSSHSFQAPEFYTRRGYEAVARVTDYPVGHEDVVLVKRLDVANG